MNSPEHRPSEEAASQASRVLDAIRAGLREDASRKPHEIFRGFIESDPEYVERARAWEAERNRLMNSDDSADRQQAMSFGVIPSPEPPIIG